MHSRSRLKFNTDDKLGLKDFATRLEQFLLIDSRFVPGSLVVSLNGKFGSGKSTLIKMWENDLNERRNSDESLPIPITLNAWEDDYCGDPLLSVTSGLISSLTQNTTGQSHAAASRLKDAAQDLFWFSAGLANSFISKTVFLDIIAAETYAEKKRESKNEEDRPDAIKLFKQKKESINNIREELSKCFGHDKMRALVFIDELDRCRPDYAIHYLETIKHIFDSDGVIFVLAIDPEHLGNSARSMFGIDLDVNEYMRKFIHRSFAFPRASKDEMRRLASHFLGRFLNAQGIRTTAIGDHDNLITQASGLFFGLEMTARQLEETCRTLGHFFSSETELRGRPVQCYASAVVFVCALKVARPEAYTSIGREKWGIREIGELLRATLTPKDAAWWLPLCYAAIAGAENTVMPEFSDLLEELEIPGDLTSLTYFINMLGQRSRNLLQEIYHGIEKAMTI